MKISRSILGGSCLLMKIQEHYYDSKCFKTSPWQPTKIPFKHFWISIKQQWYIIATPVRHTWNTYKSQYFDNIEHISDNIWIWQYLIDKYLAIFTIYDNNWQFWSSCNIWPYWKIFGNISQNLTILDNKGCWKKTSPFDIRIF